MKFLKKINEKGAKWEESTIKDILKDTEDKGYWVKGTVKKNVI